MKKLFEKSITKKENCKRIDNYYINLKEVDNKIAELEKALYDATISSDFLFRKKEIKKNNKLIVSLKEQLEEEKNLRNMLINDYNFNLLTY